MNTGSDRRSFWAPLFIASVLTAAVLAAGCASTHIPGVSEKTHLTPEFPQPCSANDNCSVLDSCADKGFDRCSAFASPPGLKRQLYGRLGSLEFRAQAVDDKTGQPVSLWHDVPLVVSEDDRSLIVNAFFEVSAGSQAKLELNKWAPHNPIWQDRSSVPGQDFQRPRYYAWSPAPSNYGALPRTWENVLEADALSGYPGDTDPIDAIDVGRAPSPAGIVYPVKVIGALGMIDGTDLQTDWKIFVINIEDPRAGEINDISDIPQSLKNQWGVFWRFYKTAHGLRQNFFYDPASAGGFSADPAWLGAADAREIVHMSAAAYRRLTNECLNLKLPAPYWVPGCNP